MECVRRHFLWICTIFAAICCPKITAQGDDDLTTTTILPSSFPVLADEQIDIIPKTVITITCLAGALIFGMLVAKLVEYCHERRSIRDNASDMSDYTRELLKAQLMLAFNKRSNGKKGKPEDFARKYGKLWFGKVARNKARKIKANRELIDEKFKEISPNKNKPGDTKTFLAVPGSETPVVTLTLVNETKKPSGPKTNVVTPRPSPSSSIKFAAKNGANTLPNINTIAPDEPDEQHKAVVPPKKDTAKDIESKDASDAQNKMPQNKSDPSKDIETANKSQSAVDTPRSSGSKDTSIATSGQDTNNSISPVEEAESDAGQSASAGKQTSPVKTSVKASVTKANVGSRPVSAGLKKPGMARPLSGKAQRPTTAKGKGRPNTAKTKQSQK